MRVCVDATSLLLRSAGVKNYIYYWLDALKRYVPEHEFTAFPFLGEIGELNHERSTKSGALPRIAALHACNALGPMAMKLAVGKADVFHASNQVHHAPSGTRLTATLYDMTCLLMPQNHTAANVRAEQRYVDRILNRADGLVAISQHTRNDALKLLKLSPERIEVIYPGVPPVYFGDIDTSVITMTKPYVLCLGTIEPRKNIDTLLDAWEALPQDVRQQYDLIVAGPQGWAPGTTIARLKSAPAGIQYLGYVDEKLLPAITAAAYAFAYPSLYEGFGFPVAQSMAAGVPGVTSNVSSLPEVARDSAYLIDPKSPAELRDALIRLLTSPSERTRMSLRAREIAREYTWESAARKSADFFSKLA